MLSEEEKKAIEWFKKDLMFWLIEGKDYVIIDNGEIPKMKSLLNLIENQQKEIEEKTTIIMAGAEKVKQLEKEIQRLEKDNDTLSELVIVNEDKVIKELDLISKDKIREVLKDLDEFDTTFFNVNSLKEATKNSLKQLLEENNE